MAEKYEIPLDNLRTELQEMVGETKLKVKLDKHINMRSRIDFRDDNITVSLNPSLIRNERNLENVRTYLAEALLR